MNKVEIWRADDGKEFDTEIECLRYENAYLREVNEKLNWQLKCQTRPTFSPPSYPHYMTTGVVEMPSGIFYNRNSE